MKLACLCYLKKNGKTLMIHRVKKKQDVHKGKWNGLGGKFEAGETPEQAVVREIKEESGYTVKKPVLKGVLTFPLFTPGIDWYVFVFVATRFTGRLSQSDEGNLEWIDDKKINKLNLWKGDRVFLPWLKGNRFFSAKFVYRKKRFISHTVSFY